MIGNYILLKMFMNEQITLFFNCIYILFIFIIKKYVYQFISIESVMGKSIAKKLEGLEHDLSAADHFAAWKKFVI
jgi:hypothetical protein